MKLLIGFIFWIPVVGFSQSNLFTPLVCIGKATELNRVEEDTVFKYSEKNIVSFDFGEFGKINYVFFDPLQISKIENEIRFYSVNFSDTFKLKDSIYIYKNHFPNLFLEIEYVDISSYDVSNSKKPIYTNKLSGECLYSTYLNGKIKSSVICNNDYGTVKIFFNKRGRIISKGAFIDNKKNGDWVFYRNNGKIKTIKHFKNGIEVLLPKQ